MCGDPCSIPAPVAGILLCVALLQFLITHHPFFCLSLGHSIHQNKLSVCNCVGLFFITGRSLLYCDDRALLHTCLSYLLTHGTCWLWLICVPFYIGWLAHTCYHPARLCCRCEGCLSEVVYSLLFIICIHYFRILCSYGLCAGKLISFLHKITPQIEENKPCPVQKSNAAHAILSQKCLFWNL